MTSVIHYVYERHGLFFRPRILSGKISRSALSVVAFVCIPFSGFSYFVRLVLYILRFLFSGSSRSAVSLVLFFVFLLPAWFLVGVFHLPASTILICFSWCALIMSWIFARAANKTPFALLIYSSYCGHEGTAIGKRVWAGAWRNSCGYAI